MDEHKAYSLPEAARLAKVSEDELRCAIKDGMLRAELMQNTGAHQISAGDLDLYLRRTRNVPLNPVGRKKRILIIDDEINFANILKLELERDPKLEAKFATWGRDGILMAGSFEPDLCLIDFMLPDITGDEVLTALRNIRELRRTKMVVYSAHTREAIRQHPNLEARLAELGADEFMSKSAGLRALTSKVYELLGLEKSVTRALKKPL